MQTRESDWECAEHFGGGKGEKLFIYICEEKKIGKEMKKRNSGRGIREIGGSNGRGGKIWWLGGNKKRRRTWRGLSWFAVVD